MNEKAVGLVDLYALSEDDLRTLMRGLGENPYRAKQLHRWLYHKRVSDFTAMTDLPAKLQQKLAASAKLGSLRTVIQQDSADGTQKRLCKLHDGQLVESVLMPYADGRFTACLSTQAGCAMGCVFCATGQMGFARHLTAAEIFEQAMLFARELAQAGKRLSNIVMMGMGEPFHNYDASLAAVRRFIDDLGIGARRITISTVGLAPQIRQLADEGLQVTLAVSLHRADDEARTQLMPVNRRWDIAELLDACQYYTRRAGRRVSFEWAAIAGENDTPQEAHRLGQLLRGMRCHVNIIPLNPTGAFDGAPARKQAIDAFQGVLESYGVASSVRVRRGIDIEAGCGQLKTAVLRLEDIGMAKA